MRAVVAGAASDLTDAIVARFQAEAASVARAELGGVPDELVDVLVIDTTDDRAAGAEAAAVLGRLADAVRWCEQVGRQMCERGDGVIVVVGTTDGYHSQAGGPMRSTVQGGALGLVRGYGIEFAPFGVRVVGVAYSRAVAGGERVPPIGRHPTTDEVSEAVLFVAGPDASYVVAETLRVDGGYVAYQMF
jgi:NAD(P)-dependent dehydrogenase (short-subunit alcohol dehydrogenase family)